MHHRSLKSRLTPLPFPLVLALLLLQACAAPLRSAALAPLEPAGMRLARSAALQPGCFEDVTDPDAGAICPVTSVPVPTLLAEEMEAPVPPPPPVAPRPTTGRGKRTRALSAPIASDQ